MEDNDNITTVDFDELAGSSDVASPSLPESTKLKFASYILLILALMFVGAALSHVVCATEESKEVFDTAKTILPAIVTLVIGYYFGNKN